MTRNNSRQGHLRNHIIPIVHMRQFGYDDLVYTYDFEEANTTAADSRLECWAVLKIVTSSYGQRLCSQ